MRGRARGRRRGEELREEGDKEGRHVESQRRKEEVRK